MKRERVLVIEDESDILELLRFNLKKEGYEVDTATDGERGVDFARTRAYDVVLLDLMLPGIDGLEVCRRLRSDPRSETLPVIMVTSKGEEADILVGLGIGADDYVTKPFSPGELAARVQAVLRRSSPPPRSTHLRFGNVTIDADARRVEVDGATAALTAREFDLLLHFAEHPGLVFTREQLLSAVWRDDFDGDAGTVTVHVRRLRAKVEADPPRPVHLKTVWGVGYRLDP